MEHPLVASSWVEWIVAMVTCLVLCGCPVASNTLVVETESMVESGRITCWTCPNKTSNGECNGWAPDITCPTDRTVCRTVHRFERDTGSSVLVNKECVAPSTCSTEHVGCWETGNSLKECVSCCSTSYCNKEVAMDNQTALQLSISLLTNGASFSGLSPLLTASLLLVFSHCGT